MSLRAAINRKCTECIYDPGSPGTKAQQIAVCTSRSCPLFGVRPKTAKVITASLLGYWGLSPGDLDEYAQSLVQPPESARLPNQPSAGEGD